MEWHYTETGGQQKSVSEDELRQLARSGLVSATTLVWNESMPEWQMASEIWPDWFASAANAPQRPAMVDAPAPIVVSGAPRQAPGDANACAIASLICGIVGLFCTQLFSIAAVVTGHIALSQIRKSGVAANKGLAIAGLVLGYVGIGIVVLILVFYAVMFFGLAGAGAFGP
ncbi:MAG: DUF4190 domain-containing protein [Verrucomicrobiota bacterium]